MDGNCRGVTYLPESDGPFMEGFYLAAHTAYQWLFWPVLDEMLWEDATFTPEPIGA